MGRRRVEWEGRRAEGRWGNEGEGREGRRRKEMEVRDRRWSRRGREE
jgi:hypothetical protein